MKKDKPKIDPMKGVVKPEILTVHIRQCVGGNLGSKSYVRGALQWLAKHPPNPHIVPLLRLTLEKSK